MQLPTVATIFKRGIAYSPDGYLLAGCSNDKIIIWDTQTGGVVKEIECKDTHNGLDILWSLDGETIGTISQGAGGATVFLSNFTSYNSASGTTLLSEILQSLGSPCFWACDRKFKIAITSRNPKGCMMDIFETGITLAKIKSFPLKHYSHPGLFSPTTYRIAVSIPESHACSPELLILDINTLGVLLQAKGSYQKLSFSHDGSLFAASTKSHLSIWKYASSGYFQLRKIQQHPVKPQFSPTLLSIFGLIGPLLCIIHLEHAPNTSATESTMAIYGQPLDAFSLHGTFIATTCYQQSTIAITNLNFPSPFPSQFIDTDLEISEIALTGNVLLVNSSDTIVGWLLTEDGEVDGILGNSRADQNDSLWKISPQDMDPTLLARLRERHVSGYLEFAVKDEIAAITFMGVTIHAYDTRTGEIIEPDNTPEYHNQSWYRFNNPRGDCNLYHHKHKEVLEYGWPVSQATLQKGWIKDPGGKHRLWLYAHWRSAGSEVDWLNKVSTLRLRNSSDLVVIKF
jgi:WD40 repeat protein